MKVSVHEEPPKGGTTNGPAMVIIRKDNMDRLQLRQADKIEVVVLVDNYSDELLEDPGPDNNK